MSGTALSVVLLSLLSYFTASLGVALTPRESPRAIARTRFRTSTSSRSPAKFVALSMMLHDVPEGLRLARLYGHGGSFLLGAMLSAVTYVVLAPISVGRVGGFAP